MNKKENENNVADTIMDLANRIRKIREAKNLTQAEVADRCNMSPSAYGKIERNARSSSFDTLSKVANALEVDMMFLIDIKNPNFIETKNNL